MGRDGGNNCFALTIDSGNISGVANVHHQGGGRVVVFRDNGIIDIRQYKPLSCFIKHSRRLTLSCYAIASHLHFDKRRFELFIFRFHDVYLFHDIARKLMPTYIIS